MRTCVVTKEKLPKVELLRIVRCPDGKVVVDTTGKLNGKGCYIKKEMSVLETAKKKHILDRVLEVSIEEELYEEIEKLLK